MKWVVFTELYPREKSRLGDVFVHVRVKEYQKKHDVQVISLGPKRESEIYDGVPVEFISNPKEFLPLVEKFAPDRLIIHFFQPWMLEDCISKIQMPIVIWVHGYEATGWYRRMFDHAVLTRNFLISLYLNFIQQSRYRKLIQTSNRKGRIHFVFVSQWMRKVVEIDTLIKSKHHAIIHNPINAEFFKFSSKPADLRFHVLLLRSFQSLKYANDVSVAAILQLSKSERFASMKFTIIGDGKLFDSTLAPLRNFSNVSIERKVMKQPEITELHRKHGVFLCPTRQDSQGVSMCEAMSSGLVPIASNNSGIPEFVTDGKSGLLTNSPQEIADAFVRLVDSPDLFQKLSSGAAEKIRETCALPDMIRQELNLIEGFTG